MVICVLDQSLVVGFVVHVVIWVLLQRTSPAICDPVFQLLLEIEKLLGQLFVGQSQDLLSVISDQPLPSVKLLEWVLANGSELFRFS